MSQAARERARAVREQQEARARRQRRIVSAIVAAAVLLGAAIVALAAAGSSKSGREQAAAAPPANTDNYAVVVGKRDAKPRIEVFEDFQCPACAQFEASAAPVLRELAQSGRARVDYYLLSFLGAASKRAANAAFCAADADPIKFLALHDRLYANQPPEDNSGYTEADLLAAGTAVGLTGERFAACVRTSAFAPYVTAVNAKTGDRISGTPTVFVNGKELDRSANTADGLRRAVSAAAR